MKTSFFQYAGIALIAAIGVQAPIQPASAQATTQTTAAAPGSTSSAAQPNSALTATPILQSSLPGELNGPWKIDPNSSSITFTVRNLGLSEIAGRFDKMAGTLTFDATNNKQSSIDIVIQAASVDTNNKQRDTLVRGAKFLDTDKYPQITFKSTDLRSIGHNSYIATGNLTLHGVTQQIMLPFTIGGPIRDTSGKPRFGLEILTSIDRQDYGITQIQKMDTGAVVLSDNIDFDINIQAAPASAATTAKGA